MYLCSVAIHVPYFMQGSEAATVQDFDTTENSRSDVQAELISACDHLSKRAGESEDGEWNASVDNLTAASADIMDSIA